MNHHLRNKQAKELRTNIKATIAQLDSWESNQDNLRHKWITANSENGGSRQRLAEARSRAQAAQGSQLIIDPACQLCGSPTHLSDECDFIAVETSNQCSSENPSTGIHRGIVHQVFQQAADLYKLLYPRFYPGPSVEAIVRADAYLLPVPLAGPDFQEIGISRTVARLSTVLDAQAVLTKSLTHQLDFIDQFVQAFHSAAFPLPYTEFRANVHKRWIKARTGRLRTKKYGGDRGGHGARCVIGGSGS
jgi:hypothetical protein